MPQFYWDEDDQTFYDEDGDPVDIEPSDEMVEAAIQQRMAEDRARNDAWTDHVARIIISAEEHLGRQLTAEEVGDFQAHMETHDGNPPPLDEDGYLEGNFYADLSDDESRRSYMEERLSEDQPAVYSSFDQGGETGGDAWAEAGADE